MIPGIRHSIRRKLLIFYGVAILAVVVLYLTVQIPSYRATVEFEDNLARYHDIHRFRTEFAAYHERISTLMRETPSALELPLDTQFDELGTVLARLEMVEPETLEAFFALQATRRGLDAFFMRLDTAARKRIGEDRSWFSDMAHADRIAAYMDSYLSTLLSEAMQAGDSRYQSLLERLQVMRMFTAGSLVLFIVLFGIVAFAFSASIVTPVRRLAEAAERIAAGELDVPAITAHTGDEVEVLAQSFSIMNASIVSMMSDLKTKADLERQLREEERELMAKERLLREALFISLQDQIQPHFLFNALNTIARMAMFEKARKTENLILAMARMFRYALGAPESMVSVNDELAIVGEYLAFQELRFGERLRWTITAKPAAADVTIPRFTIQPFVENAVRHGIEPTLDGGSVDVTAHARSGRLFIVIKDTGVGMHRDAVNGIGIGNVRKRLELVYGSEASLELHSTPGHGTTVRIMVPATTGADVAENPGEPGVDE